MNFEANAFVYDKEFATKMEKTFEDDMKLSTEVTLEDYESRGLWIKIKEAVSVLLSDIL